MIFSARRTHWFAILFLSKPVSRTGCMSMCPYRFPVAVHCGGMLTPFLSLSVWICPQYIEWRWCRLFHSTYSVYRFKFRAVEASRGSLGFIRDSDLIYSWEFEPQQTSSTTEIHFHILRPFKPESLRSTFAWFQETTFTCSMSDFSCEYFFLLSSGSLF